MVTRDGLLVGEMGGRVRGEEVGVGGLRPWDVVKGTGESVIFGS